MKIRICPPCLFIILGASNDIEEISVSGKYGTTSDDTYNTLLSFIYTKGLGIDNKTRAKIQNFMQINCNSVSLQTVNYLPNASLHS